MKKLIAKLTCFVFRHSHEWNEKVVHGQDRVFVINRCSRCGKLMEFESFDESGYFWKDD